MSRNRPPKSPRHRPQVADPTSSLIDFLEIAEIDPQGALRELSQEQAEIVRRAALCWLRESSRRDPGGTPV